MTQTTNTTERESVTEGGTSRKGGSLTNSKTTKVEISRRLYEDLKEYLDLVFQHEHRQRDAKGFLRRLRESDVKN